MIIAIVLIGLVPGLSVLVAGCEPEATPTPVLVKPTVTSTPVSPTTAPPPRTGPGVEKWALWADGPHLRGANIWQRVVVPDLDGPEFLGSGHVGPPYTQADLNRLAALGANTVNISGPGLFTERPPYEVDEKVQAHLDNLLDMIGRADMFAVITARTGPGRSDFTFYRDGAGDWFDESLLVESVWEDQAAQDAWVEMWHYTAERYRDNPIVVGYDLMCEPNSAGILLDIWEPDEFYPGYAGTLYDWNQLYPRITAAIREVDADTPILIAAMGWSAVRWLPYLEPTGDPRTVYMVHQYEPQTQYTHQEPPARNTYPGEFDVDWDGVPDSFNRQWLDETLSSIDAFRHEHGMPVAVNEFGVVRWVPGGAAFMDDQMDLFERRGMNHALWVWDPAWEPWTEEVDAFNFRHGPDPEHHADVASSDLMDVIAKYWKRNTARPSNSTTLPAFTAHEARPDGALRLTDPPPGASDQNPTFSPDGQTLLFTRFHEGYNDGPAGLYLLSLGGGDAATGSGQTPVALLDEADHDSVNLPGSSWNAATGRIAFSSDRQDADEIWTMAADGSGLFRVTYHDYASAGYFIEPSFSPDGQWIVFEVDPDVAEEQQQGSIWKVRADGTGLAQLTDGAGGGTDDRQPNWSPTGERILFQRRQPGSDDWNLYTMVPDGSDVRQVTTAPSSDTDASWSPDGRWIVYSSDYGGLPVPNIFVIPAHGGQPIRVTHDNARYDGAPSWSPDGGWISFESHPGDQDVPAALWLIAAPVAETESDRPSSRTRLVDVAHWFYMIDVNLEAEMVERIAVAWVYETSWALGFVSFVSSRGLDRYVEPVP